MKKIILLSAIFATPVCAEITLSPIVPGYSTASQTLRTSAANAPVFSGTPGAYRYNAAGKVVVSGRVVPITGKLTLNQNLGSIIKKGLRLTPSGILGAVALAWLADQFMTPDPNGDGMLVPGPGPQPNSSATHQYTNCSFGGFYSRDEVGIRAMIDAELARIGVAPIPYELPLGTSNNQGYVCSGALVSLTAPVPAIQSDFDALPDPTPALARELPYASYMPDGAPVGNFVADPAQVPMGEPYVKPDGSTVQPMASVSNAGNGQVSIDTYDKPILDPAGEPYPQSTLTPNQDTIEKDTNPCASVPDGPGCPSELGTVADTPLTTEAKSIALIAPVSVGGPGSCPAPLTANFMGRPISFSYDLPCQAAGMLKPLILALAWLASGVIFIGGVRQ